jgi:hypothetical protein
VFRHTADAELLWLGVAHGGKSYESGAIVSGARFH